MIIHTKSTVSEAEAHLVTIHFLGATLVEPLPGIGLAELHQRFQQQLTLKTVLTMLSLQAVKSMLLQLLLFPLTHPNYGSI